MQNWLNLSEFGINFKKAVMPSGLTFPILIIEDIEKYNNSGAVSIRELSDNKEYGVLKLGGDKKNRPLNTTILYISKSIKDKSGEFEIVKTLSKILNKTEKDISALKISISDESHIAISPFANIDNFNNKCKSSSNSFYGYSLFKVKADKVPENLVDHIQGLLNKQHALFPKNNIENISFSTLDSLGYNSSIIQRVFTNPDDALKQGIFLSELEEINLKSDKSVLPISINADRSINVIFDIEKIDGLNYCSPTWHKNFTLIEDFNSVKSLQENCKEVLNARPKTVTSTQEMADHLENISNVLHNIQQSQRSVKHFKSLDYNNDGVNIFLLKNKDSEWRYIEKSGFNKVDEPLNSANYKKILEKLAHSNNVLLAALDQKPFSRDKIDSSLKVVFKNHSDLLNNFTTNDVNSIDKIFLNDRGVKLNHQVFERNIRDFEYEIGAKLNEEITVKRLNEINNVVDPYLNINQTGEYSNGTQLDKQMERKIDSEVHEDIFDIYEKYAPSSISKSPTSFYERKYDIIPKGINDNIDKNHKEANEILTALQYIEFYSKPKLNLLLENSSGELKQELNNSLEREVIKSNILKYQMEKFLKGSGNHFGSLVFNYDQDGNAKDFDNKAAYDLACMRAAKQIEVKYSKEPIDSKLIVKLDNFVNEFQTSDNDPFTNISYLDSSITSQSDYIYKEPLTKSINNAFYSDIVDKITNEINNGSYSDLKLEVNKLIDQFEKATRLPFSQPSLRLTDNQLALNIVKTNIILDIASKQTGEDIQNQKNKLASMFADTIESVSSNTISDISGKFLISNFTSPSKKLNLENESYFLDIHSQKVVINDHNSENQNLLKIKSTTFESAKKEAFLTHQILKIGESIGVLGSESLKFLSKENSNESVLFKVNDFEINKANISNLDIVKKPHNLGYALSESGKSIIDLDNINGIVISKKLDFVKAIMGLESSNILLGQLNDLENHISNQKYLSPTADENYFINKNNDKNESIYEMLNLTYKSFENSGLNSKYSDFQILTTIPKNSNDTLYSRIIPSEWVKESDQILNICPIDSLDKKDIEAAINVNINNGSSGLNSLVPLDHLNEIHLKPIDFNFPFLSSSDFMNQLTRLNHQKLISDIDSIDLSEINNFRITFTNDEYNIPTLHLRDSNQSITKSEALLVDITRNELTSSVRDGDFNSLSPLVEIALASTRFNFNDYVSSLQKDLDFIKLSDHLDNFKNDFTRTNVEQVYTDTLHRLINKEASNKEYIVFSNDDYLPRMTLTEVIAPLSVKIDDLTSYQDCEFLIQGLMQKINFANEDDLINLANPISLIDINESSLEMVRAHFTKQLLDTSLYDLNANKVDSLVNQATLYAFKDSNGINFKLTSTDSKSKELYQEGFTPIVMLDSNILENSKSSDNIKSFISSLDELPKHANSTEFSNPNIKVENLTKHERDDTDLSIKINNIRFSDILDMSYEKVKASISKNEIWPEFDIKPVLDSGKYDFDAAILIKSLHKSLPSVPYQTMRDEKVEANSFNYFLKQMHGITNERTLEGVIASTNKAISAINNFDPNFLKSNTLFSNFNQLSKLGANGLLNNEQFKKDYEHTLIELTKALPNNNLVSRMDGIISKVKLDHATNFAIIKNMLNSEPKENNISANSRISKSTIGILSGINSSNKDIQGDLVNLASKWGVSIQLPSYRNSDKFDVLNKIDSALTTTAEKLGNSQFANGILFADEPQNKKSYSLPSSNPHFTTIFINEFVEKTLNVVNTNEIKKFNNVELAKFNDYRTAIGGDVAGFLSDYKIPPKTEQMKAVLEIFDQIKGYSAPFSIETTVVNNAALNFKESENAFKRLISSYDSYDDDMRGRTFISETFVSSQLDSLLAKQNKYLETLNSKFQIGGEKNTGDYVHIINTYAAQYDKLSNASISFSEATIKNYLNKQQIDSSNKDTVSNLSRLSKDSLLIITAEQVLAENVKKSFVDNVYSCLPDNAKEDQNLLSAMSTVLNIDVETNEARLKSNIGNHIETEFVNNEVYIEEKPNLSITYVVSSAIVESLSPIDNKDLKKDCELILSALRENRFFDNDVDPNLQKNETLHVNHNNVATHHSPTSLNSM